MAFSRDDVKAIFPDATDEQITAFLNAHHNDVRAESAAAAKIATEQAQTAYNAALDNLKNAEKQANDSQAAKVDLESRLKNAENSISKMMSENAMLRSRSAAVSAFSSAGIAVEQYEKLLDGIVSEDEQKTKDLAANIIAAISAASEMAKSTAKQELIGSTPAPAAGDPPALATPEMNYQKSLQSGDVLGIIKSADALAAAANTNA